MDFCSIASGSSGNCTFAGTDHTSILIDAGISGKRITEGLHGIGRKPEELDGILLTHEHIDHIRSIGVLMRKHGVPLFTTRGTANYILNCSSLGRIDPELVHVIEADHPFTLKDLTIEPFHIWHDAAEPVGFRMSDGSAQFAVATDMGCYDEYIVDHLKGLDGILLEANHDVNMLETGPYPYPLKRRILGERGHLSNVVAGRLLSEILHDGMQAVLLGHLSKENNYEALAFVTVTNEITMGDNPYKAEDFLISIAGREKPSDCYHLK